MELTHVATPEIQNPDLCCLCWCWEGGTGWDRVPCPQGELIFHCMEEQGGLA